MGRHVLDPDALQQLAPRGQRPAELAGPAEHSTRCHAEPAVGPPATTGRRQSAGACCPTLTSQHEAPRCAGTREAP